MTSVDFYADSTGIIISTSQIQMQADFDQAGFPSRNLDGRGKEYILPNGMRIRVMEPTPYAPRRASFENSNGQPISPFTGKPPQPSSGLSKANRKQYVRNRTHVEQKL